MPQDDSMDHVKFTPPGKGSHIPRATIQRMAVYVQVLETLMAEEGCEVISSERLAGACTVGQYTSSVPYSGLILRCGAFVISGGAGQHRPTSIGAKLCGMPSAWLPRIAKNTSWHEPKLGTWSCYRLMSRTASRV